MKPNIIFGLINIFYAVILILVCVPLIRRKIKMNYLYGVRIKKAFESEENWYNINAYGGKQLAACSIPLFIVGIICFAVPVNDVNIGLLPFLMGVVPITICVLIALVRILIYARNL